MANLVKSDLRGDVLHITMQRPEARNALSTTMIAELTAAFVEGAERAEVRAVVLSGAGKDFCAGADIGEMLALGEASAEDNRTDARRLGALFQAIHAFPRPVVARVHGNVFGGGNGLVAAADIAFVADGARFAFSEVRLGIIPAVISPFVVRRIGSGNARRLFLSGERFDAARAVAIGLAAEHVPVEVLDGAINHLLDDILRGSPDAQRRAKLLLDQVETAALDQAVVLTPEFIAAARASEDGQEGLRAFREERAPSWAPTAPRGEKT